MSESSFPFEAAAEEPASGGGDRRKLVAVGGLGALMVAVLGYFVVLPAFAGDTTESAPLTIVKKAPQKKAAKAAAKPAAKKPLAQPASYDDVAGRKDPFLSLSPKVVVETAAPAAPTTTDTTGGATTGGTTGGTSGSATTVSGQRVALVTVYDRDGAQYAQTKVGETVYTPKVGDVFAGQFKLLATSGKTATYLFGDEQFTLSVGQEVLK
jgi:hypothetical protein